MPHRFGCAATAYQRQIHPRILIGPADLARLKKNVRSGDAKKVFSAIRQNVAPIVDRLLAAPDDAALDALLQSPGGGGDFAALVDHSIHDIAMVAVLADDPRAHAAAARLLVDATAKRRGAFFGYHAFAYDLLHDTLPGPLRVAYAQQAVAAARQLIAPYERSYYADAGGNGVLVHMFIAMNLLLAARGDDGAEPGLVEPLLQKLLSYLRATMHTAIEADGYPAEDVGYGTSVVSSLANTCHALFRAGLWNAYTQCPRFRNAGRAILHFVQPWGEHLAATGDYPLANCDHRENLLVRLAHVNGDPSLLWLLGTLYNDNRILKNTGPLSAGKVEVPIKKGYQLPATAGLLAVFDILGKPLHPAKAKVPTAFRDRSRGIVSFRDQWADDGTLVVFDAAQRGGAAPGHHHLGSGHFSLTALGEYFAIDLNRYGTEQSEHNLTLVDGKSGRSTHGKWGTLAYTSGHLLRYEPAPFVDWAGADGSLQHDCYWARRHVLFVKGRGVQPYLITIDDINKANDFREFWWTLNTSPENTIALRGESATITGWRRGNLLDVHFALPDANEFPRPHALQLAQDEPTTSSWDYIKNPRERVKEYIRPAAMVSGIVFQRPRLIAKVSGYNGRFMSVMLPRRPGTPGARFERLPSLGSSLAVRINTGRFEDTVIWAYEHQLLEAGDVRAVGQWCVVRRATPTGNVVDYAMGDGVELSVAGKRLRVR